MNNQEKAVDKHELQNAHETMNTQRNQEYKCQLIYVQKRSLNCV